MTFSIYSSVSFALLLQLQVTILKSEQVIDDGGWWTDPETMIAQPGPCNIEKWDSTLTQEEFLSKYASGLPVVVKAVTTNKLFKHICRKDELVKKYGGAVISDLSYRRGGITLTEYIADYLKPQRLEANQNESFYWFGDHDYAEWAELFDHYEAPPYSLPGLNGTYSFGVAGMCASRVRLIIW